MNFKNIGISTLNDVRRLLHDDLQIKVDYWLGNIYYNSGDYVQCQYFWNIYLSSFGDKNILDSSVPPTKLKKISLFLNKYSPLCNSIKKFQWNINYLKFDKNIFSKNKEESFLKDNETLRRLRPNIAENFNITYDYFKVELLFYGKKDIKEAITLLMSIIQRNKYYMKANYLLWDIIKTLEDYHLLIKYSYYLIKICHSEHVVYADWLNSYKLYAKALFLNNMYEDAIHILMNTLDIFVTLPIDEIKFINVIHKKNNISLTNEFVNSSANVFFSKKRIFEKSIEYFRKPIKKSTYNPESTKLNNVVFKESLTSFYQSSNNNIEFNETISETNPQYE